MLFFSFFYLLCYNYAFLKYKVFMKVVIKNSKIEKCIGILLLLIIPASLLSGYFVENKPSDWFYTVSDTYYISPVFSISMICLSFLLFLYKVENNYEKIMNIICTFSCLLVVVFPCSNLYGLEKVGCFQLPDRISSILHTIFSVPLIMSMYFTMRFIFTKNVTRRNQILFKIFSYILIISVIAFILGKIEFFVPVIKIIAELFIFSSYGLCWILKSQKKTELVKK